MGKHSKKSDPPPTGWLGEQAEPRYVTAPAPRQGPSVFVEVLSDKNATAATARIVRHTGKFYDPVDYECEASGSSKREQGDRHEPTVGEMIAVARALRALSDRMLQGAMREVRANAIAGIREQAQQRERARRRERAGSAPHRTREEWEALKERAANAQQEVADYYADSAQQEKNDPYPELTVLEKNAALARTLGLEPEPGSGYILSSAPHRTREEWEALKRFRTAVRNAQQTFSDG